MSHYLYLLRNNRDYRFLWLGHLISLFGDWFNLIASAALVAKLTESGMAVSFLFLARFLPLFFFTPPAGVLADRFDRRRLMILADILRAVTVLGFLFVKNPSQLWFFYFLTIMQFALSALFTPARSAVLTNLVPKADLITASALDASTWSLMFALGALIGGIITSFFGIEAAFLLDSLTFLLSAAAIAAVRPVPVAKRLPGEGSQTWLDGLRYLRQRPFLTTIVLLKAGGALIWGGINVLEVVIAQTRFAEAAIPLQHWMPTADRATLILGLMYAISGIGTGIGPLLLRAWLGDEPFRLRRAIFGGFFLLGFGVYLMGIAQTVQLLLLGTLIRTIGSGTVWVFSASLLQMLLPDQYRGRIFAVEFAALTLVQSVSILAAGLLQDMYGLSAANVTMLFAFAAIPVAILWAVIHWFYRKTALPDAVSMVSQG